MRLFLDAESDGFLGELISMALVADDGREWYEVLPYFQYEGDSWAARHVIPVLRLQPIETREAFSQSLQKFLSQFDWVHIVCDWPGDIRHFCDALFLDSENGELIFMPDKITFELDRTLPNAKDISRIPHNALEDAKAIRIFVVNREQRSARAKQL
jgi:hypothetical protein